MAKKPSFPTEKPAPCETPEAQFLDLWEENIRLVALNNPSPKFKNIDG